MFLFKIILVNELAETIDLDDTIDWIREHFYDEGSPAKRRKPRKRKPKKRREVQEKGTSPPKKEIPQGAQQDWSRAHMWGGKLQVEIYL